MRKHRLAMAVIVITAFITCLAGCGERDEPHGIGHGSEAGEVRINPKDGAEMVWVPAGEFLMGSTDEQVAVELKNYEHISKDLLDVVKWRFDTEMPQRKVHLDGYWIYKYPVTVAQYRKFCEDTDRSMPAPPVWGWKDDHPMGGVTWQDTADYAKWAGASLPTEAQWEKAARGTDGRLYPWGNEWDASKCANGVEEVPDSPQPVGSYPVGASPYGAMDMAGNVWEWCADWFDPDYYKNGATGNPTGPSAKVAFTTPVNRTVTGTRVLRSSSWVEVNPIDFRCANRLSVFPTIRYPNYGFRCARTP